jgi:phosphoribosylaminoimidazole-succinocarboxamide synthase
MNTAETVYETRLQDLRLKARGKVRDIYEINDTLMLIVATDRISAFDVVLPDPIPGKGRVLTALSNFWFERMRGVVPNHLADVLELDQIVEDGTERALLAGRATIVKKLRPLPIEAVVRGYLAGSAWKEYRATGAVCGIGLPTGLRRAEKLSEPIFTPSTKAEIGAHDENISFGAFTALLGAELAEQVRTVSLELYRRAADFARQRGILIADTKFEFGLDEGGTLHWIDEALTPDSSRFWPADQYRPGISPPSFDKQFVRDYLETLHWDKRPPAPTLPADVVAKTAEKYREAEQRLTGMKPSF